MMQHNALAAVSRDDWSVMTEQAAMLVKTGFLPKDVSTPEKAVAIMLKGRELNIPPMQALATITVIQGKPTVSPELMAALVERDYGSNALIVEETTNEQCVVSCCKPGWDRRRTVDFTIEEAKQAGLLSNQTWQKYPAAMLRSRAISKACKTHFQASIGGMYTPEELGASVEVVDGDVVIHPDGGGYPPAEATVVDINEPKATEAQMRKIHALGKELGLNHDRLTEASLAHFGLRLGDISVSDMNELIDDLSQRVNKLHALGMPPLEDEGEIIDVPIDDELSPELAVAYDMLGEATTRDDITNVSKYMDEHHLRLNESWMRDYTAKWEQITGRKAPTKANQPQQALSIG